MVGREKQLDGLELQIFKVFSGDGSIVNVIGEAGIGKSRLIAELRSKEELKRVTLLEGRALSIGRNLSFNPIIEILKRIGGITEGDNELQVFQKMAQEIKTIHREAAFEITAFVAALMGIKAPQKYAE